MAEARSRRDSAHVCSSSAGARRIVAKRSDRRRILGFRRFAIGADHALVAGGVHKAFNEEWLVDRRAVGAIPNASGSHYIDRFPRGWGRSRLSARCRCGRLTDRTSGRNVTQCAAMAWAHAFSQQARVVGEVVRTIRRGDRQRLGRPRLGLLGPKEGNTRNRGPGRSQSPGPTPARRSQACISHGNTAFIDWRTIFVAHQFMPTTRTSIARRRAPSQSS